MAYLLRNICTKYYWNPTNIVEIIVGGWVVSFFETQCTYVVLQCGLKWLSTWRSYGQQYTIVLPS